MIEPANPAPPYPAASRPVIQPTSNHGVRIPALFNSRQVEQTLRGLTGTVSEQSSKMYERIKTRLADHRAKRLTVTPEKDLIDTFRRNLH
ncbi:MAG TPA: hypothetical protein VGE55_08170 [Limnobacter sp.]|uniref:hypothetical protein n=1 Tax=Limnobacter sp. TaxID=2003368 RepID=UPI002ED838A3